MPTAAGRTIFMDESGFTGNDLLNVDQPVFCVASSDLDEATATHVLRSSFPDYKGAEFKFGALWGRPTNRKGLPAFAGQVGALSDHLFAYHIDKAFATLVKFVDSLIEPMFYRAGMDFYAGGFGRKYCNRLHFGLTRFCDRSLLDSVVRNYHELARRPTERNLERLSILLRLMAASTPDEVSDYFDAASSGLRRFRDPDVLALLKGSNDLQLTTVLSVVGYWRRLTEGQMDLVHDASSNFFRRGGTWAAVTRASVPPQVLATADGLGVPFPLNVRSTTPVDSRRSVGVQFCDVLAGLVARAKSSVNEGDATFVTELVDAGLGRLTVDGIGPGTDFPVGPPRPLDRGDAVDQFLAIMRPP